MGIDKYTFISCTRMQTIAKVEYMIVERYSHGNRVTSQMALMPEEEFEDKIKYWNYLQEVYIDLLFKLKILRENR